MQNLRIVPLPFWLVLSGLWMTTSAFAEPLDLRKVPAASQWVVHIDCDALRQSVVAKNVVNAVQKKHPASAAHLALVQGLIGFNPLKDLHAITLFGPEVCRPAGVLVVHVDLDQRKLVEHISHLKDYKVSKPHGLEVHTWTHQSKHDGHTHHPALAMDQDRVLVGNNVEALEHALKVRQGELPGIGDQSPLAGRIPEGTSILMRASGIHKAKLPHRDPLAKQIESARFVIGEQEGESFVRVRAVMTNPQVVEQLQAVVTGIRAAGLIHADGNAAGKQMVEALRIKSEGKTLTLLWSAPASQVWKQIETHARKIAELRARHRAHMKQHRESAKPKPRAKPSIEDF